MTEQAGLLVRHGDTLSFLPAHVAKAVVAAPRTTHLPWDFAQIALVFGEVVAVIECAPSSGVLVLCEDSGQVFGLSGLVPERVGSWPEHGSGVNVDGAVVPAFDLDVVLARGTAPSHSWEKEP